MDAALSARIAAGVFACASVVPPCIEPATAQSYPARPIRMIAPYPPGGGVDTVARMVSERLAPRVGQSIVVDNRPGAGATIGADLLAKSTADGYTVMLGSLVDYSIAPHFHKSLGFDMARDFTAIVEIGYGTIGLVVTPALPATSVKELVALAQSKPGQLVYASTGHGGIIHLNGEMFRQMAKVDYTHVPYKGTAQMLPDLMTGRVQFSIDNVAAHLPHIRAGRVRILAVATRQRSPLLPDVPTMTEAGVPGYLSATNYTLFAPKAVGREPVVVLNREVNAVIQQGDLREKLLGLGIALLGSTAEAAQARIPEEMARWATVIRAGNIRPE